jgi:hypothetical protein
VSHKLRARLGKIRARRTLKDGKEMSMEELLSMLADVYEEKEASDHDQIFAPKVTMQSQALE